MVKSGKMVENSMGELVPVSSPVYFPEINGKIDPDHWYQTENEALYAEAVAKDELFDEMDRQIKECYRKKHERWNLLRDKYGIKRKFPV